MTTMNTPRICAPTLESSNKTRERAAIQWRLPYGHTVRNATSKAPRSSTARSIFFFPAEDGIRGLTVTGVQTCALPISHPAPALAARRRARRQLADQRLRARPAPHAARAHRRAGRGRTFLGRAESEAGEPRASDLGLLLRLAEGRARRALGFGGHVAQGEAAGGEERDAGGHPEERARLAHDGERDARRLAEREQARELPRAQLVNARAQRDELEDHRDDAIDRLEEEGRKERRGDRADERNR